MATGRQPSTKPIAVGFGVAILGGLGAAATWLAGGQTQLEGVFLALAFGGLGYGLIRWAKHFTDQGPFIEEREAPVEDPSAREEVSEDLMGGGGVLVRRRALGRLLGGALAAIGLAALVPLRWLGRRPTEQLRHTPWGPGVRLVLQDGTPVHVDDLPPGGILVVFPEGHTDAHDAQTILLRLRLWRIRPLPGREDWAPDGFIAYSRLCTHAACPVGLYEQETDLLYCPCHQSVFDATRAAEPLMGPATRRLPQLPLMVDEEGYLRARGDYPEQVGPGFWEMRG